MPAHMLEPVEKAMRPRLARSQTRACMPCIRCTCVCRNSKPQLDFQHRPITRATISAMMQDRSQTAGCGDAIWEACVQCSSDVTLAIDCAAAIGQRAVEGLAYLRGCRCMACRLPCYPVQTVWERR